MTQFSDTLYVGSAPPAGSGVTRGVPVPKVVYVELGQVATAVAGGVVDTYTATQATTLSATGSLVSGGVATFDVARNVAITTTWATNLNGFTFTVAGTDQYNQTMTEKVLGPTGTGTIATGNKAFKTVTSVSATGAVGASVSVGTGVKLGLPYRLADVGKFTGVAVDGVDEAAPTLVAGYLTTSNASTATTADVRGTLTTTSVPNGSKRFTVNFIVGDTDTSVGLYGLAQA